MENKKSKYIFIVFSVLCIMMIVLSSVKDGLMNPIRNTIGYMLVPVQTGVNKIGSSLYDNLKERRSLNEVKEENRKLQEKIDVLTEDNNRLNQNQEELGRLRKLYELDQNYLQYDKIAARVIAKDSEKWFQVFRIDKGTKDGIRVDQNVMANGGLIGIVTDVGLNYATVRSIIDDESRVSAMGMQSNDNCIVAGDLTLYQSGRLKITNISKNAAIHDGDRIVTSNISSKFMPGILIGYAVDITEDNKHLMKNGYLIPAAKFDDLSEVLVVKQIKADSFKDENDGKDIPEQDTENVVPESTSAEQPTETQWTGMEGLSPLTSAASEEGAQKETSAAATP
ncbi:MAG TPA: rod shape-determining protein MreC [Oribacterium sp.]|nr:rod shape-determining protein MreC [Oribacterium sp.]